MERALGIAILASAMLLLVPWLQLLAVTWAGDSKGAAPSALAFAAAAVLAWRRRDALHGSGGRAVPGLAALGAAAAGYALAVAFDVRLAAGLGAVGILASLLYLGAGLRAVRAWSLPLVLLALATPLPAFAEALLTRALVALTVAVTPAVLAPITGPIEVEGALLHLPGGSVAVVDDCSGLGGLLLFVPLAVVLLAFRAPRTRWHGALVLAAALPLAIAGSLVRVWVSALLVHFDLPLAESDAAHEALGLATLLLALVALLLIGHRMGAPAPEHAS